MGGGDLHHFRRAVQPVPLIKSRCRAHSQSSQSEVDRDVPKPHRSSWFRRMLRMILSWEFLVAAIACIVTHYFLRTRYGHEGRLMKAIMDRDDVLTEKILSEAHEYNVDEFHRLRALTQKILQQRNDAVPAWRDLEGVTNRGSFD